MDRIVVGIDRSENARRALPWAIDTAEAPCPVVIVPPAGLPINGGESP